MKVMRCLNRSWILEVTTASVLQGYIWSTSDG